MTGDRLVSLLIPFPSGMRGQGESADLCVRRAGAAYQFDISLV